MENKKERVIPLSVQFRDCLKAIYEAARDDTELAGFWNAFLSAKAEVDNVYPESYMRGYGRNEEGDLFQRRVRKLLRTYVEMCKEYEAHGGEPTLRLDPGNPMLVYKLFGLIQYEDIVLKKIG